MDNGIVSVELKENRAMVSVSPSTQIYLRRQFVRLGTRRDGTFKLETTCEKAFLHTVSRIRRVFPKPSKFTTSRHDKNNNKNNKYAVRALEALRHARALVDVHQTAWLSLKDAYDDPAWLFLAALVRELETLVTDMPLERTVGDASLGDGIAADEDAAPTRDVVDGGDVGGGKVTVHNEQHVYETNTSHEKMDKEAGMDEEAVSDDAQTDCDDLLGAGHAGKGSRIKCWFRETVLAQPQAWFWFHLLKDWIGCVLKPLLLSLSAR